MAVHTLYDDDGEIRAIVSLGSIQMITPTENGVCIERFGGESKTITCRAGKGNKKSTVEKWMRELSDKWKAD